MQTFVLERGSAPLLVSLPHDGTFVPEDMLARMAPAARALPDTDWHVGRLYAIARALDASILRPLASRYVVDLNRSPEGGLLYPGQHETALVPMRTFADELVWQPGEEPDAPETAARVATWWRPYHEALAGELARLRAIHPRVVLWDGHSIRAQVPMLFAGRLPDFNLGTAGGASCAPSLQAALSELLAGQDGYTHAVNGRFKGGWITRHYGRPLDAVHAVQLELAQCTYMDEVTLAWDEDGASAVQRMIGALLRECLRWASESREM
jgi:N-formylglutamate deformylase